MNPLNDQQLNEIEACVTGPLGEATVFDHTTVGPLVAEVRRLRAPRTLTESEHSAAWHAIEGAAGEEGADPGTVLAAVLAKLGINPPAEETHVVADDSDDPEHIDDCPGCEAFALTGHVAAVRPAVETGA